MGDNLVVIGLDEECIQPNVANRIRYALEKGSMMDVDIRWNPEEEV